MTRSKEGWKFGKMLRNHNLQRNPTRLTYTIYFIQFLGPTYMGKYRNSPPGIIATSVKSGRLQNEDTWLTWRFLYKDLTGTDWVMFRFARRSYDNYEKKGIKAASLGHRAWVFPFLCLLHPLQCLMRFMLHLPLQHSWKTQGDQMTRVCCVANARYNSRTRIHNTWGAVKIYYNCLVCFWRVIVFWGGPYRFTGLCCFRHHPSRS